MINSNNIIACTYTTVNGTEFNAINPATGELLEGSFTGADSTAVNQALKQATEAFKIYRTIGAKRKAAFLRAITGEINLIGETLISRAVAESGLPVGRITGEMGRTTGQLRMFADMVEEGSWVDAVIDEAQPNRLPIPRSDIRRMLVPIGPVVVFGASNFPLAFSVAGGDTASALASGCPVIVKVHPAHPGTSALVGSAISKAAEATGMPKGVFSLLYDNGYTVGAQLVKHEQTKAVAFTGSFKGGMALLKLAQDRESVIPVFTEMGSINPVILLPAKLNADYARLAVKFADSITLGAGQFCTNPGLILAVQSESLNRFISDLGRAIEAAPSAAMLTPGIWQNYQTLSQEILSENGLELIAKSNVINAEKVNQSVAAIAKVSALEFISNKKLREEIFGPWSLIVVADDVAQLEQAVQSLEGQLTATVMAEREELPQYATLLDTLTAITGRVILNGVPTGVEVCAAMQHGGPFPATSDSRFTSVGTGAIYRFVRPVAWQDWEDSLLPPELQVSNPLNIWRQINNNWTKE
ncbi:NADP-dependent aldehyde dehydrogenase [Mucilaginibacter gracilis]|uniref:NADP-dependent aldehyde dehydrogenase n=1 Tax=Mucilaginibacter gracilis TaxID=423350 RepID=A0A495IW42_9SPHI|nr:aldehyde dehydrogenase (NADP(+)) [Mucilaginibacter gracilis]RKR80802.1 NADP-dependent aldehyde dehydrogenase [Mucilaginibacter gracilis]